MQFSGIFPASLNKHVCSTYSKQSNFLIQLLFKQFSESFLSKIYIILTYFYCFHKCIAIQLT